MKNGKPAWLGYGERVRTELATMESTKSGKRLHEKVEQTYVQACQELGYEGSLPDWYYLLGIRLPRNW